VADPCAYVRNTYGVPARIGGRVRFVNTDTSVKYGTIKGATNHLSVLFDGEKRAQLLHPTWHVAYLIWPVEAPRG
jgi:hypothetical protein